jgi:serine/threonine protein kinase
MLLQRSGVPTLSEVLSKGPVPIPNCLRMLYGIASAVEALTAEGLVARDLDPDRILVCPRRGALLADPGIPLDVLPRGVEPDQASAFASPEERAGLPIDARSNVYSLGAVFLAAITAPDGERLPVAGPAEDVIARAMATEPDKRDLSPSEFIVALAISLGFRPKGEAAPAPKPPKQTESAPRPTPREQEPVAAEPPPKTRQPERRVRQTESDSVEPTATPRVPSAQPKSRASRVPPRRGATAQPDGAREPKPKGTARPKSRAPRVSPPRGATPQPNGAGESKPEASAKPKSRAPRAPSPRRATPQPNGAGESKPEASAKPKSRAPRAPSPRRATPQPNGAGESKPEASAKPKSRAPRAPPPRRSTPQPRGTQKSGPKRTTPRLRVPMPTRPRLPALPRMGRPRLPAIALRALGRISPVAAGLAVAVLAACLLFGMVLGRNISSEAKSTRVESAAFAVDLPEDWGETGVVRTPWVKLSAPVAAAPFGERGVGLVAGEVSDLTAIDRSFRRVSERTEVRLGRLQAWRYAGLRPKRGLAATAYLAPTTGAPLLVVCHARVRTARARLRQCEEIASTIALKGEKPESLVRVERHEQQVASVIGSLRRERMQGRRRLANVNLASDQARAARSLERAYRVALRRIRGLGTAPGTGSGDDLLSSLRAAAKAYGQLAAAAAHANKARYRAARNAVIDREEAVQREAAA